MNARLYNDHSLYKINLSTTKIGQQKIAIQTSLSQTKAACTLADLSRLDLDNYSLFKLIVLLEPYMVQVKYCSSTVGTPSIY